MFRIIKEHSPSTGCHLAVGELRHSGQHGRSRPCVGQRVHRTAVAERKVRGGVPEGLFHAVGSGRLADKLLSLLLPGAYPPIARLPHAGGGLSNGQMALGRRASKINEKSRAKNRSIKHYSKRKQASAAVRDLGGVSRAANPKSYTLNNPFGCPNIGVHLDDRRQAAYRRGTGCEHQATTRRSQFNITQTHRHKTCPTYL